MHYELPQIALVSVRTPKTRKTPFHHQFQNVGRVPLVRLLLAHKTSPDLRRISDPDLVPQIFDQLNEPRTVACGFHADQHRRRQPLIKLLGVTASMDQFLLPRFPGLRVQPIYLLPAGMEITPYNHHRRLLSPQRLWSSNQDYRVNRAFALIQSILRVLCERVGFHDCDRWVAICGIYLYLRM